MPPTTRRPARPRPRAEPADATREFFDSVGRGANRALVAKMRGTIRFDLTADGAVERWLVRGHEGRLLVSEENAPADCVFTADKALFEEIVSGRKNAVTAILRGAVALEGDLGLLATFQRLLPAPAPRAAGRASKTGSRR